MSRRKLTKAALTFSACLFVLWWALGTGATLAWFSDSDAVRNEFQIGLLKMEVRYKNDTMNGYDEMGPRSKVFYDEALYEPGYTQVVYLEIENNGDVDFNYKVAVTVEDVETGKTAWGEPIYLPNYLRYGVVFAESESELKEKVNDRLKAREGAEKMLDTWSENSPYCFEAEEDPHYAALIVYMPEDVGNVANYRGFDVPKVVLGVTVFAQQADVELK